jgi:antitoxin MazE
MAALVKRLTKLGNSLALVLDRPVLSLLGIDDDTQLEISTPDGKKLQITPVKPSTAAKGRRREK